MGNASFLITFGLNDKRLVCWSLQFTREGLVIFFSLYCRGSMHCQNSLFMCIRMVTSKLLPSLTQQEGNLDCHLTVSIIYLFYLTTWLSGFFVFCRLFNCFRYIKGSFSCYYYQSLWFFVVSNHGIRLHFSSKWDSFGWFVGKFVPRGVL